MPIIALLFAIVAIVLFVLAAMPRTPRIRLRIEFIPAGLAALTIAWVLSVVIVSAGGRWTIR